MPEKQAITAKLDRKLLDKFRLYVTLISGSERGAISDALEEALRLWIEKKEAEGYSVIVTKPE